MTLTPSHHEMHTRYRPGQTLYTVANGPYPPPDVLIPGEGLPAFTLRKQMLQELYQAQTPYPVGSYTTKSTATIGLHDTQTFTPEDGTAYRAAGFQLVELPDGELRILDRHVLIPKNNTNENLGSLMLSDRIRTLNKAGGQGWMIDLLKHHYRTRHKSHARNVGGWLGNDSEYVQFHREAHALGADHDHRSGVLSTKSLAERIRLRKSEGEEITPTKKKKQNLPPNPQPVFRAAKQQKQERAGNFHTKNGLIYSYDLPLAGYGGDGKLHPIGNLDTHPHRTTRLHQGWVRKELDRQARSKSLGDRLRLRKSDISSLVPTFRPGDRVFHHPSGSVGTVERVYGPFANGHIAHHVKLDRPHQQAGKRVTALSNEISPYIEGEAYEGSPVATGEPELDNGEFQRRLASQSARAHAMGRMEGQAGYEENSDIGTPTSVPLSWKIRSVNPRTQEAEDESKQKLMLQEYDRRNPNKPWSFKRK